MTTKTTRAGYRAVRGQLAPFTPPDCVRCGITLVTRRADAVRGLSRQHSGHGFCESCFPHRHVPKPPWVGPLPYRPIGKPRWRCLDLLAEYERRRGPHTTKRHIAAELGVTFACLDQGMVRGRKMRIRDAERLAQAERDQLALARLELARHQAEFDAHRINDDMIAYARRKAAA